MKGHFSYADAALPSDGPDGQQQVIALAGNPNVGKSTLFNALTGARQHTGNWPGKTVANATGICRSGQRTYRMVDLPGTYSLMAHSAEEEVARNFLCFRQADAVIVVCDATCLERNLNLALQTLEITGNVVVCVNLLDEARRKRIRIDLAGLSQALGVPVVGVTARRKSTLSPLLAAVETVVGSGVSHPPRPLRYPAAIETAIGQVAQALPESLAPQLDRRWLSLRLLDADRSLREELRAQLRSASPAELTILEEALTQARQTLTDHGLTRESLKDQIVCTLVRRAEEIGRRTVTCEKDSYDRRDRAIDRVLTSRWVGYPVMLGLLALVFWLTITGANYPSRWLSSGLFALQEQLSLLLLGWGAPAWLHGALVLGVYRTLAWVVSVMLPPMAIFFPLFTLLEDAGYLPRVAYNLDRPFQRCRACGKQALTMCMGFGCNAAGVIGCRIIDSPRERLLAILTNNFVPCNGRFPTLIALLTMFFIGTQGRAGDGALAALLLTGVILLGIAMTFFSTRLLSATVLRGAPSSFTLELPPYRRPQVGPVIVRSLLDRTLFVLGRAVTVAAPAGLVLWVLANVTVGDATVLRHCADFLDPFARTLGLDGVILLAFLLGFPANEIVVPIMLMIYLSQGSLLELEDLSQMKALFVANGWTGLTALCTMLFSLLHWPCSTTLLTIRKETGSWRWTALAFLLPTGLGMLCCCLVATVGRVFL